jgi:hypothetical protein
MWSELLAKKVLRSVGRMRLQMTDEQFKIGLIFGALSTEVGRAKARRMFTIHEDLIPDTLHVLSELLRK